MEKNPQDFLAGGSENKFLALGKNTIIQCPSCRTRFAVDSSSLAQLEFPKFHCSRCDHVFSMEESSHFYVEPRRNGGNGSVKVFDASPEDINNFRTQEDEESFDVPSWRNDRNASRGLEIPRSFENNFQAAPPHESLHGGDDISGDFDEQQMPLFGSNLRNTDTRSFRPGVLFGHRRSDTGSSPRGFSLKDDTSLSPSDFGNVQYDFIDEKEPGGGDGGSGRKGRDLTEAPAATQILPSGAAPSPWRTLGMLSLPLGAMLLVLLVLSLFLSNNSAISRSISGYFSPGGQQVAPAALHISEARFKRVTLENGENVGIISGSISNNTPEAFKEVTLEGFAFDARGKPVASQRVSAASSLAKTRIKSLTLDMIESLQSGQLSKGFRLDPGEKYEFAMALIPPENSQATTAQMANVRYFGTRIYSVRR